MSSLLSTARMYLKRAPKQASATDLYDHTVTLLDGSELDLNTLRGHPTLIVNTASKCGFTPQYKGLQQLYETYRDQGLQILGSPSGDFADQEYDTAEEVGAFCEKNYGVTFPLTQPTSVRADPDPLWRDLTTQPNSAPPNWNFAKYLVDKDGKLIKRFGTTTKPEDPEVVEAIKAALAQS
ncbi:MAG TPA: glutathione peroxidase [Solirubrobacteraceae bacterium]|nr:glutathione peroxidase [Solirubrobacteraceae bacterium]